MSNLTELLKNVGYPEQKPPKAPRLAYSEFYRRGKWVDVTIERLEDGYAYTRVTDADLTEHVGLEFRLRDVQLFRQLGKEQTRQLKVGSTMHVKVGMNRYDCPELQITEVRL